MLFDPRSVHAACQHYCNTTHRWQRQAFRQAVRRCPVGNRSAKPWKSIGVHVIARRDGRKFCCSTTSVTMSLASATARRTGYPCRKNSGEPSVGDRKAISESPRNQSSRQRRLRHRPMPFHSSAEHLPTMARSLRLAAEIRNGALCLGFASEAVMKESQSTSSRRSAQITSGKPDLSPN